MPFDVTILGTGSATPTLVRNPTAQWISCESEHYLVDCGEGTQLQILKHKLRTARLRQIFISHLHGDHYFGLFGILTSLSLGQRKESLTIYGPHGLDEIITTLFKYSDTRLTYPLTFVKTNAQHPERIFESNYLTVETVPLHHRIPCTGFIFREKIKNRNLIRERIPTDATPADLKRLKSGRDVLDTNGEVRYRVDELTYPIQPPRSYAFCSDTLYLPQLAEVVHGVDLLYHEATFAENLLHRAVYTNHSTARQAAQLAKDAQVGQLLLGHFSSRYREVDVLLQEAREVFPDSMIAEEGETYPIGASRSISGHQPW